MDIESEKVVFMHTPKTGGTALLSILDKQLRKLRRNYLFSFIGGDDSSRFDDELATKRASGNKCVAEEIHIDSNLINQFINSPHFIQAKLLFGHTTYSLHDIFVDYRFKYICVIREPIERAISNIVQLSNIVDGRIKFGDHYLDANNFSTEYWDFIYSILTSEYPVRGLRVHENYYIKNCMTHILQGTKYQDSSTAADLSLALDNSRNIHISTYDNFNLGLQNSFDHVGIPIDMSFNIRAASGEPSPNSRKVLYGLYYNAPKKIVDYIIETNQADISLYKELIRRL